MTATTFLPSVIALVAVLAVARQSKRLQPRTAAILLAAGCVVAVATSAVAVSSVVLDQLADVPWLAARLGWCTRAATTPAGLVAVLGGAAALAGAAPASSRPEGHPQSWPSPSRYWAWVKSSATRPSRKVRWRLVR